MANIVTYPTHAATMIVYIFPSLCRPLIVWIPMQNWAQDWDGGGWVRPSFTIIAFCLFALDLTLCFGVQSLQDACRLQKPLSLKVPIVILGDWVSSNQQLVIGQEEEVERRPSSLSSQTTYQSSLQLQTEEYPGCFSLWSDKRYPLPAALVKPYGLSNTDIKWSHKVVLKGAMQMTPPTE